MSANHHTAFEQFSTTIDPTNVDIWEAMSLAPTFEDGMWVSVFSMPEMRAMSMSSKMKDMLLQEQVTPLIGSPAHPPGLALWLSTVLDVQTS
ncbi:hypothetical protein FRC10_010010, partial [Ceratobasidium sp. 414]